MRPKLIVLFFFASLCLPTAADAETTPRPNVLLIVTDDQRPDAVGTLGNGVFYFRDKQRMVRSGRWKLIHYPHIDRWQLFDLRNDPHEIRDLAGISEFAEIVSRLKDKLAAIPLDGLADAVEQRGADGETQPVELADNDWWTDDGYRHAVGKVVDNLLTGDRGRKTLPVGHVAIDFSGVESAKWSEAGTLPHQTGDFVAASRQGRNQMRPDESAGACYQYLGHEVGSRDWRLGDLLRFPPYSIIRAMHRSAAGLGARCR